MPILAALLLLILLGVAFAPQWWVHRVLRRHGVERPDFPGTGAELARHLLDQAGLTEVKVEPTEHGDHYDPDAQAVRLMPQHHEGRSVAAGGGAAPQGSPAPPHPPRAAGVPPRPAASP